MNRKITLKTLSGIFLFACGFAVNAQQIFTNGSASSGPLTSGGAAAPTGYTWSELQTPNTSYGGSCFYDTAATPSNFSLADDFVVPAGQSWTLTSADFYGYQTGTGTMPIDVLRVRIWSGDPAAGGTVVFGDMTTNRLNSTGSAEAMIYRTLGSPTGTTRKVFRYRADVATTLAPGTYWIEFQVKAVNGAATFSPPVTILNTLSDPTWNAQQRNATTWTTYSDGGSLNNLAMPFDLNGTVLGVNENSFEASVRLSPNPVKDLLFIDVPTGAVVNSYEIYDITGRVVQAMNSKDSITQISVEELAQGNYILKMKSENGIASKKFIKE